MSTKTADQAEREAFATWYFGAAEHFGPGEAEDMAAFIAGKDDALNHDQLIGWDGWKARSACWQPIETAPLDVDILVWSRSRNGPAVSSALSPGNFTDDDCRPLDATHWMPAPQAPKD